MPHVVGLTGQVADARGGELCAADHPEGANHHFGGVLQALEAGVLEEVRVEQHAQGAADVVAVAHQGVGQQVNSFGVAGRGHRPSGNLDLVGYEEAVEVAGDEPGTGRIFSDEPDDVFTVVVAGVTQECLVGVVVVILTILEEPVVAADGPPGQLRLNGPAGEGTGAVPYVVFGVVANAHAEEFQELAAPVLVNGVGVVVVVVQPVD